MRQALRSTIATLTLVALTASAKPPGDLQKLRDYFAGSGDSEALRRDLTRRLTVKQVLRLLLHVEPHEPRKGGLLRFETPEGAYVVVPPNGYTPRKAWPLHIALHGHGPGQTGQAACQSFWRGEPAKAGVILACPDLRAKWQTPHAEALLLATYRDVQQRFNVRTDQVSLGGFSGGGIGTWIYGPRYPDLFGALVPRAGIPPSADELVENLNGLPIFVVHGTNDGTIPVSNSRRVVKKLQELGIQHVYRERPGGHEFFSDLNTEVVRWLKGKRRPLRAEFRYFGPIGGAPRIIHWLQLEGSGTVTVTAKLERRGRATIRLDHPERVKKLTVHLMRSRFDMGRRHIDVVVNGKAFGFSVRESVDAVLRSYGITRDLRRVFTASVTIDGSRLP